MLAFEKRFYVGFLVFIWLSAMLSGCGDSKGDPKAEAPPVAKVQREQDTNVISVDHPEQFPLATAEEHRAASQLQVTGVATTGGGWAASGTTDASKAAGSGFSPFRGTNKRSSPPGT